MPRKRKSEAEVYEATRLRMLRWKHNTYLGHCAMGRSQMNAIIDSTTATPAAKAKASAVNIALADLAILLKERVDG